MSETNLSLLITLVSLIFLFQASDINYRGRVLLHRICPGYTHGSGDFIRDGVELMPINQ